jgi:hypothetical protein
MAFIHEGELRMCEKRIGSVLDPRHSDERRERNVRRLSPRVEHNGRAPIEFDVNATGEEYLDLANSLLHVRAKISKPTVKIWKPRVRSDP